MQSILTTTTRVRETAATANTLGAKTQDRVRWGCQTGMKPEDATPQSSSV